MPKPLPPGIHPGIPVCALAPMQDVTTLPFMRIVDQYGAPDYFVTEYFRVHTHSRLEPHILESITENESERPVFAQLIGESAEDLIRTVKDLEQHPIAGIDLNMGCPAPKVYKKNVGGGLLRSLDEARRVIGTLRESVQGLFTVKTRIGFENEENFSDFLKIINDWDVDMLAIHGRTVKQGYRGGVNYERIAQAVREVNCPVIANGNITSYKKAQEVLDKTGASGVMMGRHAIRNPWIFRQYHEYQTGKIPFQPTHQDVRKYVDDLHHSMLYKGLPEKNHIGSLKKFLNFVGLSIDREGIFLKAMRRAQTQQELFQICDQYMLNDRVIDKEVELEPHEGLIARPNREAVCS